MVDYRVLQIQTEYYKADVLIVQLSVVVKINRCHMFDTLGCAESRGRIPLHCAASARASTSKIAQVQ